MNFTIDLLDYIQSISKCIELVHFKAQYSFGEEYIPKCILFIVILKEWNKLILGGGGGKGPLSQHSQVYYYVIAIYTNICTLYYIFLYVYIISLGIILGIFLYHWGITHFECLLIVT